jgi:hypothetical protein
MTRTCYRRDGLVRRSDRSFVRRIIIILALPATVAGCTAADRLPGRSSSALVSAHADAQQAKS